MRRTSAAIISILCMQVSAQAQVLDQAPIVSETLRGEYQALAECAYERIDRIGETGVKKTDLPGSKRAKLSLDQSGVRYWEITFTGTGKNQTSVEMSVVRTMWGPSEQYARNIMPEVRKCQH